MKIVRNKVDEVPWDEEILKKYLRKASTCKEASDLMQAKLFEEVGELIVALNGSDARETASEMGDVIAVLKGMAEQIGLDWSFDVIHPAELKSAIRGDFWPVLILDIPS